MSVNYAGTTRWVPERYAPQLYAMLRMVFGFVYLCHGLQKVFGVFRPSSVPLDSLFGVAGLMEVVIGPLIVVGWFTRLTAFVASGQMAAAYFIAHQPLGIWPIQNAGESPVLLCFAFLYIAARGAGRYSVDNAIAAMKWRADRGRSFDDRSSLPAR